MAFNRTTSSSNICHLTASPSPADLILLGPVRINPIPDIQTSGSRMNRAAVSGLEEINSLHIVSESILNAINLELDRLVLQKMKDVCKSPEFSNILDEYYEVIIPLTLEVCSSLVEHCSKCTDHLKESAGSFQEKYYAVSTENIGNFKNITRYFLENIWTAADPFPLDHFRAFSRVYSKQIVMMSRLETRGMKLERTFDRLVSWKKFSNRTFVVMFCSVLIGSVVSAYENAPAVLTALFAAITIAFGSIGRWINLTWAKREKNLREQREIIRAMQIGSEIVFQELGEIAELVERFQVESNDLLAYANITAWDDKEGLVIAMEDIKRKVDDIVQTTHGLSEHSSKCAHETKISKALILHRINMNHPGGYNQDIAMLP